MTADGNVTLDSRSTLNVALNGATAGAGYDQLNATGSVNLGREHAHGLARLHTDEWGNVHDDSEHGSDRRHLQRASRGHSVTIGGLPFTISYAADGGNAVVLTSTAPTTLATTTTTLVSSANPATSGQSVTLTATVDRPSSGAGAFGLGQLPGGIDDPGGRPARPLRSATFTTSTLASGSDAITAVYRPRESSRVAPPPL